MTDGMLIAGTRRLAELSPAFKSLQGESGEKGSMEDKHGNVPPLLPDFEEVPHINFEVAIAVAEAAIEEGVARIDWDKREIRGKAEEMRWTPQYARYEYDPQGRK
jgi:malate dehydrogenase (oxaloacetate-decarboxylating)